MTAFAPDDYVRITRGRYAGQIGRVLAVSPPGEPETVDVDLFGNSGRDPGGVTALGPWMLLKIAPPSMVPA